MGVLKHGTEAQEQTEKERKKQGKNSGFRAVIFAGSYVRGQGRMWVGLRMCGRGSLPSPHPEIVFGTYRGRPRTPSCVRKVFLSACAGTSQAELMYATGKRAREGRSFGCVLGQRRGMLGRGGAQGYAQAIPCTRSHPEIVLVAYGADRRLPIHAKFFPHTKNREGSPRGRKMRFDKPLSYSVGSFPKEKNGLSRAAARARAIKVKVS